jgi:hypothetical protein
MSRPVIGLVTLILLAAVRPDAHHSVLGFDSAHAVTLRGVVTEVLWNNPHTYIVVMATAATNAKKGNEIQPAPTRWVIESESPVALRRLGWTRDSVRAGDAIVTLGAPDRHGKSIMRCQSVTVEGRPALPCYPPTTQ